VENEINLIGKLDANDKEYTVKVDKLRKVFIP